jgi:hypothetical protein
VKNKRESKPARRNTLKTKKESQARKTRKTRKINSQENKQSHGNEETKKANPFQRNESKAETTPVEQTNKN